MLRFGRFSIIAGIALIAAGCISTPSPKYQPSISNTESLLKSAVKLRVGSFVAARGVEDKSLVIRGWQLEGGSDGTFGGYLREAAIKELQTASAYEDAGEFSLTGTLTRNELNASIKTGSAIVGAEFVLTRDHEIVFKKSLEARHEWESSFVGVVALDAAVANYSVTVQKLLGKLFADEDFVAAARSKPSR
ncbi:MAG: hypothetical protein U1F35_22765 [Steroidobacteraceae bacterium]